MVMVGEVPEIGVRSRVCTAGNGWLAISPCLAAEHVGGRAGDTHESDVCVLCFNVYSELL
jgi:hypothetical protein